MRFLKLPGAGDPAAFAPTSVVLQRLLDDAPGDHFTLSWVLTRLRERAFGIIMLLLAIVAMGPAVSPIAGLLLAFPACQMIANQPAPTFPRRIGERSLPTSYLKGFIRRAVPALRYIEKFVHPRWPTPIIATKRVVGLMIVILDLAVVLIPIPFSNVLPALVIASTALAYLEEDGVLLSVAMVAGLIIVAIVAAATWGMVLGANWVSRF
jgi:hypothetical protein